MSAIQGTRFAGHSDTTPYKMDLFKSLFVMQLMITKNLRQRSDTYPDYFFIDLTAGQGEYEGGLRGSPLLFIDAVRETGEQARAVFCEAGHDQLYSLRRSVPKDDRWSVLGGDHTDNLFALALWITEACQGRIPYGLILADPNDTNVPVDQINQLLKWIGPNRMDVAIHASANAFKRAGYPIDQRLDTVLSRIHKKHRMTWDVYGKWEWTFTVHSNWNMNPSRYAQYAAPAVQQALRARCGLTKSERAIAGSPEFVRPKDHTARMRSICEHPSFAVCGQSSLSGPEDGASAVAGIVQLRLTT